MHVFDFSDISNRLGCIIIWFYKCALFSTYVIQLVAILQGGKKNVVIILDVLYIYTQKM